MKRLLVTGGLGFIGSNFIRYVLKERDWTVVNVDKQTYSGNPENLRDVEDHPRYRWVKADITDGPTIAKVMKGADGVVHFAAETHVDRSLLDAQPFLKTNVEGTYVLLEAAREAGVKLFLHVSTDEVYGSVEVGESLESDPLNPSSPYSASKAASDHLVQSFYLTYRLPTIITRCSNNFGPYQFPEKALPLLITNAMEDRPFPLYGDGSNVRDWLYVLDHVKALIFLIEKGTHGEIYNIGGGCTLSNLQLVHKVLEVMGKPRHLIQPVPDRPGHDKRYALNCNKLKNLGWHPEMPFEEALRETIAWYQSRPDWWRRIKGAEDFKSYYRRQYASLAEYS